MKRTVFAAGVLMWTIIAERDISEAFAPVAALRLEFLALGLAVIPAIIGLGYLLHRDLIRPMHQLLAADRQVLEKGPVAGLIPETAVPRGEWMHVTSVRNDMLHRLEREEDSPEMLTARQREVLQLIAESLGTREIAARLSLSENTIKGYVQEILQRLGARNRIEAVMLASRRGWL